LCLDFDGTLSEIVPHPKDARPVDGVGQALSTLTRYPTRIKVAIVSGRDISEVRRMLGIEKGIVFSGTHGLEIVGADGVRHLAKGVENAETDLQKARSWLSRNAPGGDGFVIEDKQVALATHYRMVDPELAAQRRAALRTFVENETRTLRILEGNKVDELLPRGVGGKGPAVRLLLDDLGPPAQTPIYFGDDTTDEDAFWELRDDGVGVLVGPARPSWARYRVDNPREVTRLLAELAQELGQTGTPPGAETATAPKSDRC
jgi:trehalose-phosphatase